MSGIQVNSEGRYGGAYIDSDPVVAPPPIVVLNPVRIYIRNGKGEKVELGNFQADDAGRPLEALPGNEKTEKAPLNPTSPDRMTPDHKHRWLAQSQWHYEGRSMGASERRKRARVANEWNKREPTPEEKDQTNKAAQSAREWCNANFKKVCDENKGYREALENEMLVRGGMCAAEWVHRQRMAAQGDPSAIFLNELESRPELAKKGHESAMRRAKNKYDRLTVGCRWFGGPVAGNPDYHKPAFVYRGLRSDDHHILQIFCAKIHRIAKLRVGHRKEESFQPESKLLGLDCEYVSMNGEMVGCIRLDMDADFLSYDDLKIQIEKRGCPMPNILTGAQGNDGIVKKPHLIWVLDRSVGTMESHRASPQYLLRNTEKGLVEKLLDMGADPGGLSNPLRTKNPLSPLWSYAIGEELPYRLRPNETLDMVEPLPSLSDKVNTFVRVADLERDKLSGDRQAETTESNALWIEMRRWAFEHVQDFRDVRCTSRDEFQSALEDAGFVLMSSKDSEKDVLRKARSIVEFTWERYRMPKAKKSAEDIKKARSDAARQTSRTVFDRNKKAVENAVADLQTKGVRVTKAEVARVTGLTVKTVAKHWKDWTNQKNGGEVMTTLETDTSVIPLIKSPLPSETPMENTAETYPAEEDSGSEPTDETKTDKTEEAQVRQAPSAPLFTPAPRVGAIALPSMRKVLKWTPAPVSTEEPYDDAVSYGPSEGVSLTSKPLTLEQLAALPFDQMMEAMSKQNYRPAPSYDEQGEELTTSDKYRALIEHDRDNADEVARRRQKLKEQVANYIPLPPARR